MLYDSSDLTKQFFGARPPVVFVKISFIITWGLGMELWWTFPSIWFEAFGFTGVSFCIQSSEVGRNLHELMEFDGSNVTSHLLYMFLFALHLSCKSLGGLCWCVEILRYFTWKNEKALKWTKPHLRVKPRVNLNPWLFCTSHEAIFDHVFWDLLRCNLQPHQRVILFVASKDFHGISHTPQPGILMDGLRTNTSESSHLHFGQWEKMRWYCSITYWNGINWFWSLDFNYIRSTCIVVGFPSESFVRNP